MVEQMGRNAPIFCSTRATQSEIMDNLYETWKKCKESTDKKLETK